MNEMIFIVTGFISFFSIVLSFRFHREVTVAVLVLLMLSVNVFGGSEIANVFNTQASLGTLIYGTLLFGLILVSELYGNSYARKTVFTIFAMILIFQIFGQLTIRLQPADYAREQFKLLELLASINPRFTISSLMAFLIAGSLVVYLYDFLKNMVPKAAWIGCTISLIIAQILDSLIYFGGSFYGVKSEVEVLGLISAGIAIKSVVAIAAAGFFLIAVNSRDSIETRKN